jgi:hypothetical protein
MRYCVNSSALFAALLAVLSMPTCGHSTDLCSLLGIHCACGNSCGGCCEAACGCEASCGCEPSCGCGGEVGCGCEPSCGCGSGCNGCQFAGQTWNCCNECGPPICPCTGPECCGGGCGCGCGDPCGCGDCCEPSCGYACEPTCGCSSGCGDACGRGKCCGCGFCTGCGLLVGLLDKCCGGCSGCDGELYWSEWHNDPPRCYDPCDCHGNWIGPSSASYRGPYGYVYSPGCSTCNTGGHHMANSIPTRSVSEGQPGQIPSLARRASARTARPASPGGTQRQVARATRPKIPAHRVTTRPFTVGASSATIGRPTGARPVNRGQLTRRPAAPTRDTFQR